MKNTIKVHAVSMIAVLAMATMAAADTATLKEHVGASYAYSDTADTRLSIQKTEESLADWGGQDVLDFYNGGGGPARLGLVRFDLNAVPDFNLLTSSNVISATLRLYQISGNTANKEVLQVSDSWWVEGTNADGPYNYHSMTGANWYSRNAGTLVEAADFADYVHDGSHTFYTTSTPNLAADPLNAGQEFIRGGDGTFQVWQKTFTEAASLAALATLQDADTRGYYFDTGTSTLYVSKKEESPGSGAGMRGIRWFSNDDMFSTPGAEVVGSSILDSTVVNPAEGWYEFDVTTIVQNWADGDANNGFKWQAAGAWVGASSWATSGITDDYAGATAEDESLWRPELVIEYTPVPEPATLALLAFGGLAMGYNYRRRPAA